MSKPTPDVTDVMANNVLLYKKHSGESMGTLQQQKRRSRADLEKDPEMIGHPLVNWKCNQHSKTDTQPPEQKPAVPYSVLQSKEDKRRGYNRRSDPYMPTQMFSSKPPTLHGYKPLPGDGQFLIHTLTAI